MTVKERILLSRLAEKIDRQPDYAGRIGISVGIAERHFPAKDSEKEERGSMEISRKPLNMNPGDLISAKFAVA